MSTRVRRRRDDKGAAQIAEFAPALYVLFILVLMPLLDLASTFVAGATQYLATNDFAAKAATQPDYSSALNSMATEAYQFQGNGLAQFAHMAPVGGYTGCGNDLYVVTTDIGSGAVTTSGADQPPNQQINTKTSMYELSVRSEYTAAPLVSLASVPILGDVPGLGKPMEFVFVANRPVEHPGGLQANNGSNGGSPTNGNGSGVVPFPRVASNPATATSSNITWRDPNIFQQIQSAGQTVLSVNVFTVQANSSNWTSSGVSLSSGQQVWIDTQAVGQWNVGGGTSMTDAIGFLCDATNNTNPNLYTSSLDGKVGASGTPFLVGDTLTNYQTVGTGPISMIMNDTNLPGMYADNTGAQLVRIIVTR